MFSREEPKKASNQIVNILNVLFFQLSDVAPRSPASKQRICRLLLRKMIAKMIAEAVRHFPPVVLFRYSWEGLLF